MSDPLVPLPELGAMVRAYPPGKAIPVHVRANGKGMPKGIAIGDTVTVAESVRWSGRTKAEGHRATGRVVGMAWIIEVTLPDEDAPALPDENQGDLLEGAA